MQTLPFYDDYIKTNLAPIRKALEKRMNNNNNNGMSGEGELNFQRKPVFIVCIFIDLLSIPPKQFLQILSQVQVRFILLSNGLKQSFN
jgi:hypothetical protein